MSTLALLGGEPVRRRPWPAWPVHDDRERRLLDEVAQSGAWSFDSPMVRAAADRFARLCGAGHALCVTKGTAALQLALEALGVGGGDEVIVPGLTWHTTASAVLDVNAVPILVDIEPDTYCIDPAAAAATVTPRTRAIIPVHLYGRMADMDAILALAARHGLHVIEDAAHQHGSRWRGRAAGTLGDVGAFSTEQGKPLTCGEGGIVVTSREDLFPRLYTLMNCGRLLPDGRGERLLSANYGMSAWQAAVLLAGIERLEAQTQRRDENGRHLDGRLGGIPGLRPLRRHPAVTRQACYQYCVRYDAARCGGLPRDLFVAALEAELCCSLWLPYAPLSDSPLYQPHSKPRHRLSDEYWRAIDPRRFALPVAERASHAEAVLLHQWMLLGDRSDMDDIANACEKVASGVDALWRAAARR